MGCVPGKSISNNRQTIQKRAASKRGRTTNQTRAASKIRGIKKIREIKYSIIGYFVWNR